MGKASIIMVLGIAVAMSFLTVGAQEKRNEAVANACLAYNACGSRNLAHSGANVALKNITSDRTYHGTVSGSFSGGSYTATCSKVPATTNSKILATGTYSQASRSVQVIVQLYPKNFRGAITTNPPVQTLGTLNVDGRDYDQNENIIPNQGGLAILSASTITRGGNSKYGGTNDSGTDFAPVTNFDPSLIQQNASFDNGFPVSPDAVVGVDEGTLKAIAQSGAGGSQYATDASKIKIPLKGVTYVELPNNGTWTSPNFTYCSCGFDYNSFGILVVHNANKNASLKDMRGSFYGIIIADGVDKIHGKVVGNVTVIGPQASGNCIGNGTGDVDYSSYYLAQALSNLSGSQPKIVSWWE